VPVDDVLIRRTTYREYMARWLEGVEHVPERVLQRIEQRSAEIEARMLPGDELWEWDPGGWDQLRGTSGLAILRNGEVVEYWVEWKS